MGSMTALQAINYNLRVSYNMTLSYTDVHNVAIANIIKSVTAGEYCPIQGAFNAFNELKKPDVIKPITVSPINKVNHMRIIKNIPAVDIRMIKNIIKNISIVDLRISELDSYTDYPYKAGHVICVNKRLDIWESSKKNANMISTQNSKYERLITQLKTICLKQDLPSDAILTLLVDNGMPIETAYEYVNEWFGV
jgi:hypothetical protein